MARQLDDRGYHCKRWTAESWKVGDGRCDTGSEPEVRFVFYHVSVKREREGLKCQFVSFETWTELINNEEWQNGLNKQMCKHIHAQE